MKNSTIIIFLVLAMLKTQAQDYLISFAGAGDTSVVSVVKVDNLTSGATVTLNGGDILHLIPEVGICPLDIDNRTLQIYPNPMAEQSLLTFVAPENGNAVISIVDLSGKTVYQISRLLSPGTYSFRVSGISQGMYFVKVIGKNYNYSTKLISQSNLQSEAGIEYVSSVKNTTSTPLKSSTVTIDMKYTEGDILMYKGIAGPYSTVVTDVPTSSKTITFNFVACTDNDDNNYAIVEIGTQTWMAENLNVGAKINHTTVGYEQTLNGIIEKHCYNNDIAQCEIYGGLYEWPEAMQYVTYEGAQGICPTGWHVPTDAEWTTLTTYLGGDVAGGKMKSTGTIEAGTGLWYLPNTGATNESGFTGLPAGWSGNCGGDFDHLGQYGIFWSSSHVSTYEALYWYLYYYYVYVSPYYVHKAFGLSIRCLKGADSLVNLPTVITIEISNITDTTAVGGGNVTSQGDFPVTARGVCWSTSQFPTITDPNTINGDGTGTYTSILTDLVPSTKYYVRAYATNSVGTAYGAQVNFATHGQPCPGIPTVTYEGQIYNTVLLGTQCWMAENLNVGTKINSTCCWQQQTDNGIIEKYCYNNDDANCAIYGGLYEWTEAMQYVTAQGAQGICPDGWHVPTDGEWTILTNYLGGESVAGGKMKEPGFAHWYSPNTGATNESGFTCLPAGVRYDYDGSFYYLGVQGFFWSSSQDGISYAWSRSLDYYYAYVYRSYDYKEYGFSVRCLKDDCSPQPSQSDAGLDQLNLPGTTTNLAGNTPSYGTGLWSIINGTGGTITDPTNPTSSFSGLPDNSYTLSWTISNNCGSNYDDVVISFSSSGFTCGQQLVDVRDGQSYNTVQIGTQCWMAENLNVGTKIGSYLGGSLQTDNGIIEKYCYDNEEDSCDIYGGLYEWPEAMQYITTEGAQGICPTGWHIPTDNEWKILEGTVDSQYPVGDPEWNLAGWRGFDAGGNLKETGYTHWIWPNTGATNSSGFTGLPGGYRNDSGGDFINLGWDGAFWSSSQYDAYNAMDRYLRSDHAGVNRSSDYYGGPGVSIRCLKD
jgi:uncharacterized protein (TIGR02145 family)